jgi:uncharacterized protein (DUF302 family)
MSTSEPRTVLFVGVRMRYECPKTYDELVTAVLADVGHQLIPIDDIAKQVDGWDAYEREVGSHVGQSGFMLFAQWNHGGWIRKAGIDRKVLRLVIGNPLIAITMLRHDVTSGLFAPVELLLTEEDGDRSALTYVVPSTLMVVEDNEALCVAAEALDVKLADLASKVTAG